MIAATRLAGGRVVTAAVDAMKFRSSMTLFAQAAPDDEIFRDALQKFFAGDPDSLTLARL